jgi:hydrogenase maturation protease
VPATLIIGYGNPMRSDDGIGWRVAEGLSPELKNPEIEVLPCHQLTPELAERISKARLVIFVDAVAGTRPGEWTCREVTPDTEKTAFSHSASPAGLLALARTLYGAAPQAYFFTMCGKSFDHGDSLSGAVEARLPSLISEIKTMVEDAHHRR